MDTNLLGEHRHNDYAFTFTESRWRGGHIAVAVLDGDGVWKGRSHGLLEKFNPSYSHRAGYTLTATKAAKLLAAMQMEAYVSPAEQREQKKHAAQKQRVERFVLGRGGYVNPEGNLRIVTPLGPLTVHPIGTCVCTRFDEPNRLSGHTGKWNFYRGDGTEDFEAALLCLLGAS